METRAAAKTTEADAAHSAKPDDDHRELWAQFQKDPSVATRNQLIEAYVSIVDYEAEDIAAALGYSLGPDELKSAGIFGLIDSIRSFDPSQGFRFITYCTPRIRGAILDELRARDWMPRATRARLNKLERAIKALEAELGRPPTQEQIARQMGLSEPEVQALFVDRNRSLISIDRSWGDHDQSNADPAAVLIEDKREPGPDDELQKKELTEMARQMLSRTERLVVTLYYYEQLNLREIGQILSLTESRICQIHTDIIRRLRRRLVDGATA
ncbi:MAG: FliA/WhiG family RNA polymerase sigma factor [Planctomycetota bacterium]